MTNINVVVFASGRGRSLENLIHCQDGYRIAGVVLSNDTCEANSIAKAAGIPTFVGKFADTKNPDIGCPSGLIDWLEIQKTGWIALGGFLKMLPQEIISTWPGRVINIHPALLPKFGGPGMFGMNVHRAVIEAGDKISGATIHEVTGGYDEGQIISQIEVNVDSADGPEDLAQRVFEAEKILFPFTLKTLCQSGRPKQVLKLRAPNEHS